MDAIAETFPVLAVIESVRCLECGEIYSKPATGGTVQKNPGCTSCGYVGWIPVTRPREPKALPRFAARPQQLRFSPLR